MRLYDSKKVSVVFDEYFSFRWIEIRADVVTLVVLQCNNGLF